MREKPPPHSFLCMIRRRLKKNKSVFLKERKIDYFQGGKS